MASLNLHQDVANNRERKWKAAHIVAKSYSLYLAIKCAVAVLLSSTPLAFPSLTHGRNKVTTEYEKCAIRKLFKQASSRMHFLDWRTMHFIRHIFFRRDLLLKPEILEWTFNTFGRVISLFCILIQCLKFLKCFPTHGNCLRNSHLIKL